MMRPALFVSLFLLTVLRCFSTTTITIGQVEACPGNESVVPVDVLDFIDVAALTMYIGYDPEVVEFVTLENIHPLLAGGLIFNAMTLPEVQIGISWSSLNAVNITSDRLFDIRFSYFEGECPLPFNPGYEFVHSDLTPITDIQLNPGILFPAIEIFSQPVNINVTEGSSADFEIGATENISYYWLENLGEGWNYLTEGAVYTGVNTNHLKIFGVPLALDSAWYRCELSANDCIVNSDSAQLTVDSSTSIIIIEDLHQDEIYIDYDLSSKTLHLKLNLIAPSFVSFILYDNYGAITCKKNVGFQHNEEHILDLILPSFNHGSYILQFIIQSNDVYKIINRKVIL